MYIFRVFIPYLPKLVCVDLLLYLLGPLGLVMLQRGKSRCRLGILNQSEILELFGYFIDKEKISYIPT